MKETPVRIFQGSVDDLSSLIRHRKLLWAETSSWSEEDIGEASKDYEQWFRASVESGRVIPFIARIGNEVAGSGEIWIREVRPEPRRTRLSEAVVIGMYTEPRFRKMKVASTVLERIIEWCITNGFERLTLHTSEQGRPLYEKYGFEPTTEMRLRLI